MSDIFHHPLRQLTTTPQSRTPYITTAKIVFYVLFWNVCGLTTVFDLNNDKNF